MRKEKNKGITTSILIELDVKFINSNRRNPPTYPIIEKNFHILLSSKTKNQK